MSLARRMQHGAVDDWMSQAVKARQLHDWLVCHCRYEDNKNGETWNDVENHSSSGVFLSYGLNIRGTGVGESVCQGFAKAYTMLLKAAGIESYAASSGGKHEWNIVKIRGKYYQCDVTWDAIAYWNRWDADENEEDPLWARYGTHYIFFLKSDKEMQKLHSYAYENLEIDTTGIDFHPYLDYSDTIEKGKAALANCKYTFTDTNDDGILDGDWNFNGIKNEDDRAMYNTLCRALDVTTVPQADIQKFLYNLFYIFKMPPAQWYAGYQ